LSAPVLLALERLAYAPTEAVFVGDSVYDIQAGNAAGVTTIAALWGPSTRETLAAANPTHIAECVSDLPRLITVRH
jgi:pyrophosphatase PpaX